MIPVSVRFLLSESIYLSCCLNSCMALLEEFRNRPLISSKRMLTIILVDILLLLFVLFVFYSLQPIRLIEIRSYGFIQLTLMGSFLLFLILIPLIFRFSDSQLKIKDFGLSEEKFVEGVIFFLVFFSIFQGMNVILSYIQYGHFQFAMAWITKGYLFVLGSLIAQLFGNAFFEEIFYRGFLFPQFYKNLESKNWEEKKRKNIAILMCQSIFSAIHIPVRIIQGSSIEDLIISLIALVLFGWIFVYIYLRTENIFVVIVIHAIWNAPISITEVTSEINFLILAILSVWLYPIIMKKIKKKINNEINQPFPTFRC